MNRTVPPILPLARRRPVAIVGMLAALVVVILGFAFAGDRAPASFDRAVQPGLETSTTAIPQVANVVDYAGEPVGLAVLVALLVGVSLILRRLRVAVLVVVGTGLTISATTAMKPLVGRMIHGVHLSYPSGHTASATALAMIAVLLVWHHLRRGVALVLLYAVALVVGAGSAWAQAGRMAHYPSDTVGGWCTALAVVPATAWIVDYAANRWPGGQSMRTPP